MIQKETKFFADPQSGGIDADSAPFSIGENGWVNMEMCRTGSTDAGVTNVVESIGSTRMVNVPQPSVTFMEIGSVEDTENGRLIVFYKNTTGANDKIECFYTKGELTYTVLRGVDVTGGLNFSKDFPIHSAKIVNGLLIWPDGENNQPRELVIDSGIKAYDPTFVSNAQTYTLPLNFSEITLIKPPPSFSPNIVKDTDGAFLNNFIGNNSFEFAFMYTFYSNETSVIGGYSPASRLNNATDTFNFILASMDILEQIPNTVKIVSLIVRFGNELGSLNSAKIIKTWSKLIASEAAEIIAQNNGSQVLTYDFYNNVTGETISPDDILRPFDNVPIYSETIEAAKNRVFLANNTEGYDTPATTSMTLTKTLVNIGGASLQKILFSFKHRRALQFGGLGPNVAYAYSGWYVYLTEVSPQGYYAITSTETFTLGSLLPYPTLPAPPVTVAFSDLSFKGGTQTEAVQAVRPGPNQTIFCDQEILSTSNIVSITGISVQTYNIFKPSSQYKAGTVFFDFAMRKCGVVTNDGLVFDISGRNFAFDTGTDSVIWNLSNADALNEIPDWAYYYAPVRTLNQTTRLFISSYTNAAKYATKDVNGVYSFTSNTFVTGSVGIALNTTALYQSGLGYQFSEGDVCILTRDDNTQFTLPVVGQEGNYIIVKAQDIGTLNAIKFVYEIFTPYKTNDQEPYFEMGQIYRILNPTTALRQYDVISDVFAPDSYVFTRNYTTETYFAEAMSPNDLYYKIWYNDGGKVNFVTQLGQVKKTQYISWSDTFIPNTAINGLSTFRAQNQIAVPEDCGSITKLVLTSKVQSEGTVMLSICRVETNSMYLGEVQITDSTGATQFFSSSDNVIGSINTLKGNFGCVDPTSVVQYRGNVYFLDANNGRFVQYSVNGLDPISDYKMVRFWKLWSAQYLSMTKAEIEALGDRPFVFSTVDGAHDELLISLPKLSNTPPKGYLPDYPSVVYPFDILDFRGKIMMYKLGQAGILPHWQGAMPTTTEGFVTLQNALYSFKNGNMYQHNQTTSQNTIYGQYYPSRIMFPSNMFGAIPKTYQNILSESNISPNFVYFYNDYPYQQSSDLEQVSDTESFRSYEGLWYANILRNKLVPTATGFNTDGLLTGEQMRNTAMLIEVRFQPTTQPLELRFITIGFTISKGHRINTK